jgi:hypothetical protein
MSIKLSDLDISAKLPEVKKEMPVFMVKSPTFEERKKSIDFFHSYMDLGDMLSIDAGKSLLMISKQAEIQYYRPSGALWINNFILDDSYKDERRDWKVEEIKDPDDPENTKFILIPEVEKKLLAQTKKMFEESGMLAKEAYFAEIDLDQVAQLDEKGNEKARFPGEANAKFLYKLDGIQVEGPGAKLYAFFNPRERENELTGIYHAWRDVFDTRTIKMPSVEESLERVLTQDDEIILLKEKNNFIKILDIDLTYYSMAPSAYQNYVFPVFHITGSVTPENEEEKHDGFGFSRFFNAAAPVSYAKADCYADYLACSNL